MVTPATRRRGRSNRAFYGALIVVGVLGATAVAFMATRSKAGPPSTVNPNLPPLVASGYLRGRPEAPVQIVEFADFECPACGNYATVTEPDVMSRIVDAGLANYRFFDFPLPQHANAMHASLAAACANEEGKFWAMHDALFQGQPDWSEQRNPKSTFAAYAKQIGLDAGRWSDCYDARRYERQIIANRTEGERRAIAQTPTFIIGSKVIPGSLGYDRIKLYVDSAAGLAKPLRPVAR
ncbi:MAG: hypothetical protein NVS4B3_15270 [Gemmatimonadaceae bacterium]